MTYLVVIGVCLVEYNIQGYGDVDIREQTPHLQHHSPMATASTNAHLGGHLSPAANVSSFGVQP